jgi:hypothetical protein
MTSLTLVYPLAVFLLLVGCTTPTITPIENRHSVQMHKGLFPFGTAEYTRLDDIEGTWAQAGWDIFPQKSPWNDPAEVLVSCNKVIFTVTPWTRNSATTKDNERELLSYFYDFDYNNYPRSMFRRNKDGRIILAVNRNDIYIQGATKGGVDFIGIGFFDPPIVLQRNK